MIDLATAVDYERTVDVHLELGGKKLGAVWRVCHIDNDAAVEVGREYDANARTGDRGLNVLAACVKGWDWGECSFNGEQPVFSAQNAVEIMKDARWIVPQIMDAATNLGNFTDI